jgi:uncharacterized membrane protein
MSDIAPTKNMMLAHKITLLGYFGLFLLIPFWNLWWYPATSHSNKVIIGIWLIPLIFPMVGLIKGKAYTHAWSGFIAVIYICHGLASLITHSDQMLPAIIETLLGCMFLFGGMYFAKWRGEQLGLQLPKKK